MKKLLVIHFIFLFILACQQNENGNIHEAIITDPYEVPIEVCIEACVEKHFDIMSNSDYNVFSEGAIKSVHQGCWNLYQNLKCKKNRETNQLTIESVDGTKKKIGFEFEEEQENEETKKIEL